MESTAFICCALMVLLLLLCLMSDPPLIVAGDARVFTRISSSSRRSRSSPRANISPCSGLMGSAVHNPYDISTTPTDGRRSVFSPLATSRAAESCQGPAPMVCFDMATMPLLNRLRMLLLLAVEKLEDQLFSSSASKRPIMTVVSFLASRRTSGKTAVHSSSGDAWESTGSSVCIAKEASDTHAICALSPLGSRMGQ